VQEVDDETQFRDPDYMHDCENAIFDDAMKDFHSPPKTVPYRQPPPAEIEPPATA
jgi:hypothetical protein